MSYVPSIIGYVTPFSGRSGDTLEFKISSCAGRAFQARVVRIDACDPNPRGPGMKLEPVDMGVPAAPFPGQDQPVHAGSCAWGALPPLGRPDVVEITLIVKPTLVNDKIQVLCALQDAAGQAGLMLALRQGVLVCLNAQGRAAEVALGEAPRLSTRRFTRVTACWDVAAGRVRVVTAYVDARSYDAATDTAYDFAPGSLAAPDVLDTICLAALWRGHPVYAYNGLIEAPAVSCARAGSRTRCVAHWNLADNMSGQSVPCALDARCALVLVNAPVRAVRASSWRGLDMDWKTAPQQYAAIHFHDDDLSDCGWNTSLTIRIPDGAPSAVYGLEIDNGEGRDTIPFYVIPPRQGVRNKVLFLASTMTYLAYANHARGNYAGELAKRTRDWDAYPHNPDEVTLYGASTYNRHSDGSGISLSSRLRPILTMRPAYLTFFDERGSGLRHFAADSHLTDWLRVTGHGYDVITDEDLDNEGAALLAGYDVVITGSHPEYHTPRMIEAILAYREAGGNFMYMGGNGFYWKIARRHDLPHLLEIRRAEGGIRAWASEPGEYYHQLDGEYGGMWRRNGRPPQVVGGVGFAVQGNFEGSYYVRTSEASHPDVAWLFEGVTEARMGGYGLSGGGAAGFELDQKADDLGSDEHLRVVAVSEGHGPSFKTVPEEILTWTMSTGLSRPYEGICAHMVVGRGDSGGTLFATGSITFLGSLAHDHYNNGISRIMQNCIARFTRSTPS